MWSQARFTDCLVMATLARSITTKPEIGLMGARRPVTHTSADTCKTVQASDERKNGGEAHPAPIGTGYWVNHALKRSVNSSRLSAQNWLSLLK